MSRESNRYKLAVFDLDGTLTPIRSSWEFIHVQLGQWFGRAEKFQEMFLAGRIDYYTFCRLDAEVWRGLSREELTAVVRKVPFYPGVDRLTSYLKERGLKLGLISSGLTLLSDLVQNRFGFDFAAANEILFENDRATGGVRIHVQFDRKAELLRQALDSFGAKPEEVIAFGDSEGDRQFFDLAGFKVALNPTSAELAARADLVHRGRDLAEIIPRLPV